MLTALTTRRRDFADTLLLVPTESRLAPAYDASQAGLDPLEQLALAERADRSLLQLVGCVAAVTFVLALVAGLL